MEKFEFDDKLTPGENIEKLFKHLDAQNAPFAKMLRENIDTMLPLADGPQRTADRNRFNDEITKLLDSPAPDNKG